MKFIKKPIVETIMWVFSHEKIMMAIGITCLLTAFYLIYYLLTEF